MGSRRTAPEAALTAGSTRLPEPAVHSIRGITQIAARTDGHGVPVLLLHGVGTASASFWAQFDGLGGGFELIAWDAFGYGRSSDPADARLDDYADAAAALLDAHGRRSAHVVGVSWGGVVATRLALRHPERVRTLALVASTSGRRHNAAVRAGFAERVASLEHDGARAWARARVDRLVSPEASPALRAAFLTESPYVLLRKRGTMAPRRYAINWKRRQAGRDGVSLPLLPVCPGRFWPGSFPFS